MSKIPGSIPPAGLLISHDMRKQNQVSAAGDFDALLFSAGSKPGANKFLDEFLDNITNSASNDSGLGPMPGKMAFTADFEASFGTSGPLPAFIRMMSSKLNLTPAQAKAFQDIAVNNKDATKTANCIQKIAKELEEAGIRYS